ncbi:IclR family transcriptional regulator [Candidimonas nitroreducens]|uniref:IclR family transcriptional regulator n=1 Tax=Candidimonas nitroreducens TaxID=683354 RepID=A0A225MFL0_9BURK|nr:IclR family transcriptional regulator [Candidimonas nitroreducens]OWT60097.1 IclR family transcriptional regulator [Candidimonas nitroreducens]
MHAVPTSNPIADRILQTAPSEPDALVAPGTQLIRRVAQLLRLLTANNRTGLRLVDISCASGIERSTVHRILQALIAERLVSQQQSTKRYFLGLGAYEMGVAVAPPVKLRDICQPYMNALAEQTGDTIFLTVRSGFDGVCVDRKEGTHPVKVFVLEPGRRRPLGVGASNIAILAALSPDECTRIRNANRPRIKERYPNYTEQELTQRIYSSQALGYTVTDVIEAPGVRSVGMCIRNTAREPIAAISVSTIESRLDVVRVSEVVTFLQYAIKSVESELKRNEYLFAPEADA